MSLLTGSPEDLAVHFKVNGEGSDGTAAFLPSVQINGNVGRVDTYCTRRQRRNQRNVTFGPRRHRIAWTAGTNHVVARQVHLVLATALEILQDKSN